MTCRSGRRCAIARPAARWAREVGGEIPSAREGAEGERLLERRRAWMGEFAQAVTDCTKALRPGFSVEQNFACSIASGAEAAIGDEVNAACDYTGGDLTGGIYEQSFTCKYFSAASAHQPFEYMIVRCDPNLTKHTITKSRRELETAVMLTCAHHGASLAIDAIDPAGTMDERFYRLLGEVFAVESRVHGSRGIPGDWRGKKEHGGGMMLDWGVHILDQMLLFIPEKVRFVDCRVTHITNDEVDDGFTMTLTFESGKTALLEVGTSNFINLPRWYMLGVNGTAQIDDFSGTGRMVRVKTRENSDAVPVRTAAGLTKTMAPRTEETIETLPISPVKSDIREFYQNVVAAIEGTAPLLVRHDQLMRVMRLMETGLRAAEEHRILPFE